MLIQALGDSAWLVEFSGADSLARVHSLADSLSMNRPHGVLDVVPSFASIAVHFHGTNALEIKQWLHEAITISPAASSLAGRRFEVPVCYGGESGPDLADLAQRLGISECDVIALHSNAEYTVATLGFSPGFPYLLGLPERLHLPRKAAPRLSVPAGSIAIAGSQAGIYPFASPGGWHLLGRTSLGLFDPNSPHPARFQTGDRIRFVPVAALARSSRLHQAPTLSHTTSSSVEVLQPGSLSTVQDLGRPGYESSGVSPGGAVDRTALRVANLAVGNAENAAALEICLSGPILKFHAASHIAFTDGQARPRAVSRGEVIDLSKLCGGVRAYLAIAGGIQVPLVMGSAATDLRSGFGGLAGRALLAGDHLDLGPPKRIPGGCHWHIATRGAKREIELRVLPGIQANWFSNLARLRFQSEIYQLTPNGDRMGARLSGPALELAHPREMQSQPVACGSVQVPPDGQPIVLLAERQTIGGYPQIAHVISVDLPRLACAWPGTRIRFREVTWIEARELWLREEREFASLNCGLELLKPLP
jgi:KipI family sensor histidine kinase inhibitor